MESNLVKGLVNNTALLLSLVLLYDTLARSQGRGRGRTVLFQVGTGLLLGSVAVAVMANPVPWSRGIIFDTRTVLLGATGLFFQPLSSIPAILVAAAYRLSVGGVGAPMGIATILSSGAAGILWRRRRGEGHAPSLAELYAFGLVVHALMVLSMALLPRDMIVKTLLAVGLPVMVIYPIATALLGGLLSGRAARLRTEAALEESVLSLRQTERIGRIGGWKASPETDELRWTPGVYELFDCPGDYRPGLAASLRFFAPEFVPAIRLAMARAFRDGTPFSLQPELVTAAGRRLWVELKGLSRIEEGGRILVVGTVQDITERRRAEEAVRESEARYRALFDLAPDGVVIVDPATAALLEFNDQACRQLGYSREEFARLRIPDIELKETPDDVRDRIQAVVESGYREFETVQRTKQGEPRHVFVKAKYSEVGGKQVYHCIWRDVTAEKRGQQLIQARLHLIEFSLSHTLDELLTEVLDRIEDLTGSTVGFFHFVREDDGLLTLHSWSTRTMRDFCTAEGTGSHYEIDRAGVWADCVRERRPVIHNDYPSLPHRRGMPAGHAPLVRELTLPILRGGRVAAVLGVGNKPTAYTEDEVSLVSGLADLAWDVAERKVAQEALRESEQKFAAAFSSAPTMITISTLEDGTYLEVNEQFVSTSGFRREEAVGRTATELGWMDEADRDRLAEALRRDGKVQGLELSLHARSGQEVICTYWGEPVTVGGRQRLLAVAVDITEQRRMEQQLRQAQKMEAIGTLAGGIAHDFNNILTPIMAYGELALMQLPEAHPVREDVSRLLVAAERAAALVRQILAVSRREDGGAPSPVDVGALLHETAALLRASIPATIALRVDVAPSCGPVLADASRLHQVILNLCANASYAMAEQGGVLTVSLHPAESAAGAPGVTLSVSDTGPGIAPEVQARIFEPYFTTKPAGKGSGLGLAVVHGIVASLGGEIRIRSAPGEGATFELWLPATGHVPASLPPPSPAGGGTGQRVLAVDDEPAVGDVAVQLLHRLGYRATLRTSGAEALSLFREDPRAFDAVLTDYTMPGMTGIALAAELRALRPDVPIVVATGFAEGASEKVAAAGLDGLVMKPYSAKDLARALEAALGRRG